MPVVQQFWPTGLSTEEVHHVRDDQGFRVQGVGIRIQHLKFSRALAQRKYNMSMDMVDKVQGRGAGAQGLGARV